jgi:hypothetical protein
MVVVKQQPEGLAFVPRELIELNLGYPRRCHDDRGSRDTQARHFGETMSPSASSKGEVHLKLAKRRGTLHLEEAAL